MPPQLPPSGSSGPAPRDRSCVLHLTEQQYQLLQALAFYQGEQIEDCILQAALNRAELSRITWAENNLIPYFEDIVQTNPRYAEDIQDAARSISESLKLYKQIFLG